MNRKVLWAGTLLAAFLLSLAVALHVSAAGHSVTLSWTASVVPSGAPPVTAYSVYRSTTSGGEGSTPLAVIGNVTTYTDSAVTAGSSYFYQITASNQCNGAPPAAACESAKSSEVGPELIPNNVAPGAPSGLTATVQ